MKNEANQVSEIFFLDLIRTVSKVGIQWEEILMESNSMGPLKTWVLRACVEGNSTRKSISESFLTIQFQLQLNLPWRMILTYLVEREPHSTGAILKFILIDLVDDALTEGDIDRRVVTPTTMPTAVEVWTQTSWRWGRRFDDHLLTFPWHRASERTVT